MNKKIFFIGLLLVLIGVNVFLSFFSLRWDLSKGQIYSLSTSSKKILKNLDKKLTIKFYVSGNIPTRLLPLKRDVVNLLSEYERYSQGKIEIKILDPEKNEKVKQEAQKDGLPQIEFSELQNNQYALTAFYFGLVFSYQDKKEIIRELSNLSSLEYNISAKIYKLTKKELPKILILGKRWVFNPQEDDLYTFKKIISDQFDIEINEDLSDVKLKNYATVILFDNREKEYKEEEKEKLDNYLAEGGKIFAFVDGVWVDDKALIAKEAKHNLFDFFEKKGITIEKNLVLSTSSELVSFGNQTVQFFSSYPFWLKTNRFDERSSFFSNISLLTFPWASSLSLKNNNNFKAQSLIFSTGRSWEEKFSTEAGGINLNPQFIKKPAVKEIKNFVLAALVENKKQAQIVLIPSSRFIQEEYLTSRNNNLDLVLNILNELASAGALSGISQRQVSFYLLPQLPENQKDIFKYLNIFLLPFVFGAYGTLRIIKRNRKN